MGTTTNRVTHFHELKLNQAPHFSENLKTSSSTRKALKEMKKDKRPLQFSSPLYTPLTPKLLSIVHPSKYNPKGGLFGEKVRNQGTRPHWGLDIKADIGTGVRSAEDGVVVRAYQSTTYGNAIFINHRDNYQTRYTHLNSMESIQVKVGDIVKKGQLIGESGKTGNANSPHTLPHLHFEIRKLKANATPEAIENHHSTPVDPLPLITQPKEAFNNSQFSLEGPHSAYKNWTLLTEGQQ
ncbi:MAG: M23 family metallopeptidase [Deltaproteobacteria bacterium]|nr:M23 family metallopeptidase [Deltaproteobacteria bacterium]